MAAASSSSSSSAAAAAAAAGGAAAGAAELTGGDEAPRGVLLRELRGQLLADPQLQAIRVARPLFTLPSLASSSSSSSVASPFTAAGAAAASGPSSGFGFSSTGQPATRSLNLASHHAAAAAAAATAAVAAAAAGGIGVPVSMPSTAQVLAAAMAASAAGGVDTAAAAATSGKRKREEEEELANAAAIAVAAAAVASGTAAAAAAPGPPAVKKPRGAASSAPDSAAMQTSAGMSAATATAATAVTLAQLPPSFFAAGPSFTALPAPFAATAAAAVAAASGAAGAAAAASSSSSIPALVVPLSGSADVQLKGKEKFLTHILSRPPFNTLSVDLRPYLRRLPHPHLFCLAFHFRIYGDFRLTELKDDRTRAVVTDTRAYLARHPHPSGKSHGLRPAAFIAKVIRADLQRRGASAAELGATLIGEHLDGNLGKAMQHLIGRCLAPATLLADFHLLVKGVAASSFHSVAFMQQQFKQRAIHVDKNEEWSILALLRLWSEGKKKWPANAPPISVEELCEQLLRDGVHVPLHPSSDPKEFVTQLFWANMLVEYSNMLQLERWLLQQQHPDVGLEQLPFLQAEAQAQMQAQVQAQVQAQAQAQAQMQAQAQAAMPMQAQTIAVHGSNAAAIALLPAASSSSSSSSSFMAAAASVQASIVHVASSGGAAAAAAGLASPAPVRALASVLAPAASPPPPVAAAAAVGPSDRLFLPLGSPPIGGGGAGLLMASPSPPAAVLYHLGPDFPGSYMQPQHHPSLSLPDEAALAHEDGLGLAHASSPLLLNRSNSDLSSSSSGADFHPSSGSLLATVAASSHAASPAPGSANSDVPVLGNHNNNNSGGYGLHHMEPTESDPFGLLHQFQSSYHQ